MLRLKTWQVGMSIGVAFLSVIAFILGISSLLVGGSKFNLFMGAFWTGFAILTPYTWILELHEALKEASS